MSDRLLTEWEVRELVTKAVHLARHTTPRNLCDEAVVQHTMKDEFVDGRWRSRWFRPGRPA